MADNSIHVTLSPETSYASRNNIVTQKAFRIADVAATLATRATTRINDSLRAGATTTGQTVTDGNDAS